MRLTKSSPSILASIKISGDLKSENDQKIPVLQVYIFIVRNIYCNAC